MSNTPNPSEPENTTDDQIPAPEQMVAPEQPAGDSAAPASDPQYQQPANDYQIPAGGPQYPAGAPQYAGGSPIPVGYSEKSKAVAGVLGILLGGLGIHNFYLGRTKIGAIQLAITLLSLGFLAGISGIWGFVEGILYMTSNEPRWSTDGNGLPLK
ncbi:MAG: NINE protein [Actinomycetaceae bacterium]|nr:NINE protein [Actinomycetaceae bacterium]